MNIAIIDYRSGNLHSAMKSFQFATSDLKNARVKVTSCYKDILKADKVVLPGVGSFSFCKSKLLENTDVYKALFDRVVEQKTPFLGICVGMQLLYQTSDESPNAKGLGLLTGKVKLLENAPRIPQMQWNQIELEGDSPLLRGLNDEWFYFVHSYAAEQNHLQSTTIATCVYGSSVIAAVQKGLIFGTQFHPEKSGKAGQSLLQNFLKICERTV